MDLSIFLSPDAWITLVTLLFLEIVLGVDNIVFITITTNRLSVDKRHIGRKLGLAGAFIMRSLFLCFASFLASMTAPLFTIPIGSYFHDVSVHDLIMFAGGAYLIYKGIVELKSVLFPDLLNNDEDTLVDSLQHSIGLPQAVGTIMVMDIVFSIDSVITAVGLSNYLIIMILAVMLAIILMMIFIDAISNFINCHIQMTILALVFITVIGCLLVCEGLGVHSGIIVLDMQMEKLMVYFAMLFSFVICLILVWYESNMKKAETLKQQLENED